MTRTQTEEIKNKVKNLKSQGLKRKQILIQLGINKQQYYYYLENEEAKARMYKAKKKMKSNIYWPLISKLYGFKNKGAISEEYNYLDVIKKFGENPLCYLTGKPIDYRLGDTYQLDHILPLAKGGTSDLFNLGLCIPEVNSMKTDLYLNDFYSLCELVLANREKVITKDEF